jgi:hypothetical protein
MTGTRGKVAIVEIATPEQTVVVLEICLNGETLTIADQHDNIREDTRQQVRDLLKHVRQHYGTSTNSSR